MSRQHNLRLVDRNLRGIELVLLVLGAIVSALGLVAVQLGALGALDIPPFVIGAVFWAAVLALHIVLRVRASKADPIILPIAATLNSIGIVAIYRIDIAQGSTGSTPAMRQALWATAAVVIAAVVLYFLRNHRVLQRYTYVFMLASIVLLVLPMIPGIGTSLGTNAELWVKLGPVTFQPSEYAKITLAVFFAGYLVARGESITAAGRRFAGMTFPRPKDSGPILVVWAMAMTVLVVQKDLGTSLLYFGLFLVMLYVATGLASWVVIGLLMFVAGGLAAYRFIPLVQGRVHAWLDPLDDTLYNQQYGGSYQLVQGLFGQAHGGMFGTGWGRGYPQLTPLARSDYIFTSIGEEVGLIGIFAILCLFLLLVGRGLRVGFTASDDFGRLLATGLSFVLCLQVFIVVGGVTRVIPLTGLPTPFLAAGGSSLLANWVIMALLLRITDSIRSQADRFGALRSTTDAAPASAVGSPAEKEAHS